MPPAYHGIASWVVGGKKTLSLWKQIAGSFDLSSPNSHNGSWKKLPGSQLPPGRFQPRLGSADVCLVSSSTIPGQLFPQKLHSPQFFNSTLPHPQPTGVSQNSDLFSKGAWAWWETQADTQLGVGAASAHRLKGVCNTPSPCCLLSYQLISGLRW